MTKDAQFWVVGGIYESTQFERLSAQSECKVVGPFLTRQEAQAAWGKEAWSSVDNCLCRYHIFEGSQQELEAWMVGKQG